ncbi:hypothetical protein BDW42DRAFT_188481 [Aspergillus taichungensis]|uniref:EthD domain-containing protein n=1 Tax=Aspergillus taichungensis TaxID=482145 RepID=A0A2J5HI88_9EURO|nr:hypothetical protein BDW42DRAFT_188481 [Aspergillus taichungensis]
MSRQPYIRISLFLKRKEDMTPEAFHEWWETTHADFALKIPGFKQIAKRYTQYHAVPQLQSMAAAVGTPALDFDGVAELWVERVEDYTKTMGEAEVVEACKEEAANFLGPGTRIMIGYETLVLGEPVPGLPQQPFYQL